MSLDILTIKCPRCPDTYSSMKYMQVHLQSKHRKEFNWGSQVGLYEELKFDRGYFDKPKSRGPKGWSAAYHLKHGPQKHQVKAGSFS